MTPDRVAKTKETASTLVRATSRPITRNRAEFFSRLAGIVVGEDPAQGSFKEELFLHPELNFAITFPKAWETVNTRDAVRAMNSSKDAAVSLHIADNDSKLATVLEQLQAEQKGLRFEHSKINGLPAAHTLITEKGQLSDVTLIEYDGNVYAILGQATGDSAAQYLKSFTAAAGSFRAIRSQERSSLEESRLRVQTARSGETPEDVIKRTGSTWSPEALAVANGTEVATPFSEGEPVKVAIPQAYTPR